MAGDPNKLYSTQKTMMWFAIASIVLTVSLVLMMRQDYHREWKSYQREFVKFERDKVRAELKATQAKTDPKALEKLIAEKKQAEDKLAQNKDQFKQLTKEKDKAALALTLSRAKYQDLKQFYDTEKYYLEEALHHDDAKKIKEHQEKTAKLERELADSKQKFEEAEKHVESVDAKMAAMQAEAKEHERNITQMLRDQQLLERRLKKLEGSFAQDLLNAPLIDFIAPSLQIQQVVLEDLYDDFYFAKSNKVDRCTTCHLAIDRKGFEDAPQPFRTHPNLDLFLSSNSKHPLEKIGCTVCHGGNGHSLSFVHTAHTPRDEKQKKEWEKKHHWHELEKWEAKMLPLQHTQASCTKCHDGVRRVPEAPQLNLGREIAEKSGCYSCHTVKGFENQWKIGPDLNHIESKVSRDWLVKWVHNPKEFRASSNMPRIFHLENINDPESVKRSNIAVEGIAAYLLNHSETVTLQKPAMAGDPEVGKKLVNEVGCMGCHGLGEVKANDHGPELIHLGSKVTPDWLYTWLKDPKHYSTETRMPNLRLTDEEASHITSYLLQSKNPEFEAKQVPHVKEEEVHDFALEILSRKMRRSEAEAEAQKMDAAAKLEFVGKEMIGHQGCNACHTIKGFEQAKPIGTELTKEGQKEVNKLDFGFVPIEHTRQDWFHQKLANPRIFDRDRVRDYFEKLRMPDYGFNEKELDALVTFLLSLRSEAVPLEMKDQLDLREQRVEDGRYFVHKFNCQGCHTMDKVEGRVRELYEDPGNAPPILDGEGAKVQEEWLFKFLKHPTTIRPWLKIRMPTFGFTDEETNTIIDHFAAKDNQKRTFSSEKLQPPSHELLAGGKELFVKLKCIQCHQTSTPGLTASFLAPDLAISKERLKYDWVFDWIKDPQALQPGTMMPTFFPDGQTPFPDALGGDTDQQIKAIRDYLMTAFTSEEMEAIKSAQANPQK